MARRKNTPDPDEWDGLAADLRSETRRRRMSLGQRVFQGDARRQLIFDWLAVVGPASPEDLACALDLPLRSVLYCLDKMGPKPHTGNRGCVEPAPPSGGVWRVVPDGRCAHIDTSLGAAS